MDLGKYGEQEFPIGSGRHRGSASGNDTSSIASNEQKASFKSDYYGHGCGNDDGGIGDGQATHDKRSRAGYTRSSVKDRYVNSNTAMMRAKFEGPEGSRISSLHIPLHPTPLFPRTSRRTAKAIPKCELGSKF
jgi:hypothetical protein